MSGQDGLPLLETAAALTNICYNAIEKFGFTVTDDNVSVSKISEVVRYAHRDLVRIEDDLSDGVSREKFAAYHAFWFSKMKPIQAIMRKDGAGEVVDINERVAIVIALDLMLVGAGPLADVSPYPPETAAKVGYDEPPSPFVWKICPRECNGHCFKTGVRNYLKFHENQNFEYLVRSLRYRAVGPYAMVNFLEAVAITSCDEIRHNPVHALGIKQG